MKTEKLCHRQAGEKSVTVVSETKRDTGDWKKYGTLMVKPVFGNASATDLLISYAIGLASLKY